MNTSRAIPRFVSEAHIIDATARMSRRRRDWKEWKSRLLESFGSDPEFVQLGLLLELGSLPEDIDKLIKYSLVSEPDPEADVGGLEMDTIDPVPVSPAGPKSESDDKEFSIFISHKSVRDRELATLLKEKLRSLSDKKIKVFLSQEIPGGEQWQDWVERNVINSDMLLLLHTSEHEENRWLLYEAGVYRGSRHDNRHLVCLKNPHLDAPPPQLTNLEAIEATKKGIREFLKDLLYRSTYSPDWQINPDLLDENKAEFEDAVNQIVEHFVKVQISVDYFRYRLEIGPIEELSSDQGDNSIEDTTVSANEATRFLLGLTDGELDWGDVCRLRGEMNDMWPAEIDLSIELIRNKRFFSQVLTPFNSSNGRICYPVISRVERIKQEPKNITVIFVEREPAEVDEPEAVDSNGAPIHYQTLESMLDLARHFRWNIIDYYINMLEGFRGPDLDMALVSVEIWSAIERLESDAGNYVSPSYVLPVFPESYHETINKLFIDYGAARETLKQAIADQDRLKIIDALRCMEPLNKRFLLGGLKRYYAYVQKLSPAEIQDEDVFRES